MKPIRCYNTGHRREHFTTVRNSNPLKKSLSTYTLLNNYNFQLHHFRITHSLWATCWYLHRAEVDQLPTFQGAHSLSHHEWSEESDAHMNNLFPDTSASYSGGPVSNFLPANGYSKQGFSCFSSVPPEECGIILTLGHDLFPPRSFQSIIHLSSFYSTLYSLSYWKTSLN
jgi:hypothetical protein